MKGYPKNLNTRADYLYVRDHFPKTAWEKDFQALIDTEAAWYPVGYLTNAESGINDATHAVFEVDEIGTDSKKLAQYELRSNPTAKIYRLGFTIEEVRNLLEGD